MFLSNSNSYITKFKSSKKAFLETEQLLKHTAKVHFTDPFTILRFLDDDKKGIYGGIKDWYLNLAQEHWKPTITFCEESDRKSAEDKVIKLSVIVTGARSGEVIIGIDTQSSKALLKLHGNRIVVPPKTQVLDNIRMFSDLWTRFLDKLEFIPFFSNLTKIEREMWLEYYQSDRDIYLEDVEDLEVEILSFGNSDFHKLKKEYLEEIGIPGKIIPMRDIVNYFPRKPGSKGIKGRHVLIFRRGIWKISSIYQEATSFEGIVINSKNGKITKNYTCLKNEVLFTFDSFVSLYMKATKGDKSIIMEKQTIAILLEKENKFLLNFENILEIVGEELNLVKSATKNFTPAGYKSLLQKIIRYQPEKVDIGNGKLINGKKMLECVILLLMINPGSFVPDIQRYVSGLESAFKRTIVSLFEDAFIYSEDEERIVSVITGAFLAQRVPGWKPNEELVLNALHLATKGYETNIAFTIETTKEERKLGPYTLNINSKSFEIVSVLMDEIKSFHSDLTMIRNIAFTRYENREKIINNNFPRPEIMPLCHCIDQHWAPEIAYMYDTELLQNLKTLSTKPFSKLFIKLFSEVTGINPRRLSRKGKVMKPESYNSEFEEKEFVIQTRRAQSLVLLSKQNTPKNREKIEDFYVLDYELDFGWISGMLGAVEVEGKYSKPTALVTLHPNDPYVFLAIRRPSREMKSPFLSDEREAEVIKEVKERLKKGINLDQAHPPVPHLKNCKLKLDSSEIYFILNKECYQESWETFRKGRIQIPYVQDIGLTIENGIEYGGEGIVKDAFKKLKDILDNTPVSYIQKLLTYIGSHNQEIEFKRIGRDGGGTQGAVSLDDVGAFQFIMKIKLLFPSALERVKGTTLKFKVKLPPLLWNIKNEIVNHLSSSKNPKNKNYWDSIGDKSDRDPKNYQVKSLICLQNFHRLGRQGNFLWFDTGSGKTYIVLSYLKWLNSISELPKYVFYTLPSSAFASVFQEIEYFGFNYQLMIPLKNLSKDYFKGEKKFQKKISHGCHPQEYTINLIDHDHLRLCDEKLTSYMSESIFIVDEVHKAYNETKRTSVALQLSHISREFIVLTGTPIIDTHTYKMIWWLSQIVPFEVNEKNFWVAANGMISGKTNTKVKVDREEIYIPMSFSEEKKYKSLVPSALGGTNSHPRYEDWANAVNLCYGITDDGMIKEIQSSLNRGNKVFVVAENVAHQSRLKLKISSKIKINQKEKNRNIRENEIFTITNKSSIFLTDESVKNGSCPDYKVVITPIRKAEGYTLTRMNTLISSVYPSNNATREQIEGRINRIGQSSKTVYHKTFHTGILTYILQKHKDARNLSEVLKTLVEEI